MTNRDPSQEGSHGPTMHWHRRRSDRLRCAWASRSPASDGARRRASCGTYRVAFVKPAGPLGRRPHLSAELAVRPSSLWSKATAAMRASSICRLATLPLLLDAALCELLLILPSRLRLSASWSVHALVQVDRAAGTAANDRARQPHLGTREARLRATPNSRAALSRPAYC